MNKAFSRIVMIAAAICVPLAPIAAKPPITNPPAPNLNKTIHNLCTQMYLSTGVEQEAIADQILTDVAAYTGSLSQSDKQCIRDAGDIIYG